MKAESKSTGSMSDDSDSGSDIDVLDALQNCEELQQALREHIRKEIALNGPKIFEKVKGEFGLAAKAEQAVVMDPVLEEPALEMRESWQLEEEKDGQAKDAAAQPEASFEQIDENVRRSILKSIHEQLDNSIFNESMKGGWQMSHVKVDNEQPADEPLPEADDKDLGEEEVKREEEVKIVDNGPKLINV